VVSLPLLLKGYSPKRLALRANVDIPLWVVPEGGKGETAGARPLGMGGAARNGREDPPALQLPVHAGDAIVAISTEPPGHHRLPLQKARDRHGVFHGCWGDGDGSDDPRGVYREGLLV